MTTDLAPIGTADEIASLDPADRAVMVTHALVESKQWLAVATKGTDPTPIAEFKAWAATVAEMTRQKGLASEIQSDALEMVHRAERGIGVATRNGQEAGEIATRRGYHEGPLGGPYVGQTNIRTVEQATGMSRAALSEQVYPITDGVTDEAFDAAITEARAEGNLSRANVVRKIKDQPSLAGKTRAQRVALVVSPLTLPDWARAGRSGGGAVKGRIGLFPTSEVAPELARRLCGGRPDAARAADLQRCRIAALSGNGCPICACYLGAS